MNVSAPFIRRPIATLLLAAAMLLAGAAAYTQLPVAPLPRVDFPTIQVSSGFPGASPETMASAVATPLERRLGRIAGLSQMTSVSSLGSVSITLQFDLNRDVDSAGRDVQAAIQASLGDLPANLPVRPSWRKVNPADSPILIIALRSDTLPLGQVFDAANTILAQKISQIMGVGDVMVGGGQQPAVRIQADGVALAGLGLSLEDVRNAIANATVEQPKGSLSGFAQMSTIAANDQLPAAKDFAPLIIRSANGAAARLSDVADVMDDVENRRVAGWVDGQRSVLLIIRRQPGANIIDVIERIKKMLPTLAKSVSPAIDLKIAIDRTQTIRASVADVERTLIISVILVVLVVFLFLRSARATIIPSVAVPLSLVATFGVMYLCNYSLDNLSLMALTIATGFVVDDAIVVTENVARHLEAGMGPFEAALLGAKEIGFTIVSITVSLLAVFIPLLMMGGIIGRLFREFAVTLSVAVFVSMIISLTLTPMLASRLLRVEHDTRASRLERAFTVLQNGYGRGLRWVLRHETLMLIVTGLTIALSVALYRFIPKGLFPQQDTRQLAAMTDAPQNISFREMLKRQSAVNKVVKDQPEVDHFVSFIGGGGSLTTGNLFIALKPLSKEHSKSADEIIADLRPKLGRVPGIRTFPQAVQDVNIGGRPGRAQYQYTLQDANLAELIEWAPKVLTMLQTLPGLRDINTDQQTQGLLLNVDFDRDSASRLGITPQIVDDTLYDAFGQRFVATRYTQRNAYRVVLEVKPEQAATPDAVENIYVKPAATSDNANPPPLPLSTFAKTSIAATALSVNHQGQFPSVTLSFNLAPGMALGDAVKAIEAAEAKMGLPASITASFQGVAQAYQDSLSSEVLLVVFALVVVYIVLGVLYESLIHPLTILSTLPSAGVGALLALLLFRIELSIIALVAIILLIGIVKKNAIMMIDFAIEAERDKGLTARQAIYEACLLRFRPIMMTTMAALLGGLPLALGHGIGAEMRRPLGIAIVGGLIVSQMLTLFTTPVVYLALDGKSRAEKRAARAHELAPQRT
jgi:hydrophobe/amphiphile efflux-1 (HAE1) family protein